MEQENRNIQDTNETDDAKKQAEIKEREHSLGYIVRNWKFIPLWVKVLTILALPLFGLIFIIAGNLTPATLYINIGSLSLYTIGNASIVILIVTWMIIIVIIAFYYSGWMVWFGMGKNISRERVIKKIFFADNERLYQFVCSLFKAKTKKQVEETVTSEPLPETQFDQIKWDTGEILDLDKSNVKNKTDTGLAITHKNTNVNLKQLLFQHLEKIFTIFWRISGYSIIALPVIGFLVNISGIDLKAVVFFIFLISIFVLQLPLEIYQLAQAINKKASGKEIGGAVLWLSISSLMIVTFVLIYLFVPESSN